MRKYLLFFLVVVLAGSVVAQPTTQIDIDLKKSQPVPLQTSEYADVWLEVTNSGSSTASGVQVEFLENYPFSSDPDEKTSWELGELVPGEEYQIHLQVKVDENAVQGQNSLEFRISPGSGVQFTKDVPVKVESDNNILSVESIQKEDPVAPGESGKVTLMLENMADAHLKNIRAELELKDSDIPVATRASSAKNIESLGPGKEYNLSYTLEADSTADQGVYRLPVNFEYENEAGNEFEDSVTTSLEIGGEPRLEVGITNDDVLEAGRNILNMRIVNRGFGTAEFVEVNLEEGEDYRILSPSSVYLGEMESDDYQTAEFSLFVEDPGEIETPVRLDYGENSSVIREIRTEVLSDQQLQQYGITSGGSVLPVIVVVLLVAGGGYYYWRKRKRE